MSEQKHTMHFYSERDVTWKGQSFKRRTSFAGVVDGSQLLIGKAECSNGPHRKPDVYNKPLGRKIAEGRATKIPCIVIDLRDEEYEEKRVSDIFVKACREYKFGDPVTS